MQNRAEDRFWGLGKSGKMTYRNNGVTPLSRVPLLSKNKRPSCWLGCQGSWDRKGGSDPFLRPWVPQHLWQSSWGQPPAWEVIDLPLTVRGQHAPMWKITCNPSTVTEELPLCPPPHCAPELRLGSKDRVTMSPNAMVPFWANTPKHAVSLRDHYSPPRTVCEPMWPGEGGKTAPQWQFLQALQRFTFFGQVNESLFW